MVQSKNDEKERKEKKIDKEKKIEKVIRKRYNMHSNQIQYLIKWQRIKNKCWIDSDKIEQKNRQLINYEKFLKVMLRNTKQHNLVQGNYILFPIYGDKQQFENDKHNNLIVSQVINFQPVFEDEEQQYHSSNISQPNSKSPQNRNRFFALALSPITKVQSIFKTIYNSVEKRVFKTNEKQLETIYEE